MKVRIGQMRKLNFQALLIALVAVVGLVVLAGCKNGVAGTGIRIFPPGIVSENEERRVSLSLLPDADPQAVSLELDYENKKGSLPQVAISTQQPAPNRIVTRARVAPRPAQTPVPVETVRLIEK